MKEWNRFLNLHRSILWRYGGTFYDNRGKMSAMIKNFIFAPEYSIIEKVMFVPSAFYSMKQLWHDVVGKNLFDFVKKVEVPVYIFQGKYDHQVSYALAKKFIEDLTAPQKYFYTFENSAHSPHIEENEKFNKCIENILKVYQ
jgi:pimeloyl-ACP methyl ester carboxylesterase